MKSAICPYCGAQMKRNGKTKTGAQRWRCKDCGGSKTHRINNDAKQLDAFLDWLFSSEKQMDMPGQGRTFRRMASKFWKLWPLPRFIDEIHRVIFVDGIYISQGTWSSSSHAAKSMSYLGILQEARTQLLGQLCYQGSLLQRWW